MFVYLKIADVRTLGQNKGGRRVGGEVRARQGSFGFFIYIISMHSLFIV